MRSRSIVRLVEKYQNKNAPFIIRRFDRGETTIDADGDIITEIPENDTIRLEIQPDMTSLTDNAEGQRTINKYMFFTTNQIKNKDEVEIGDGVFTSQMVVDWNGHLQGELLRTGERMTLVEGEEL